MDFDTIYPLLLPVVAEAGARIDSPLESEMFFRRIVEEFSGTTEELIEGIQSRLTEWFQCAGQRPRWVQEPEWQFYGGEPMIFLGQIELCPGKPFHDSASCFVFYHKASGITKSIIQIS